jgi:hypothetical protein
MTMTLEDCMREIAEETARVFLEHGEIQPIFYMEHPDGHVESYELDFSDGTAKRRSMNVMRAMLISRKATRYVLAVEAYRHKGNPTDEELKRVDEVGLLKSGLPYEECIVYQAEDHDRLASAHQVISRKGKKVDLTPFKIDDDIVQSSGKFVGLMPPREKERMQ